ncbi:MAG TPA: hypothetical protein VJW95_00915 [Dissulfurispiraceae bacterium]|nr:hypothetical protein [Dissulfurispiraceae bacterium]
MELKYVLYFLIGGMVISVVTYFASHARPLLAAFIANMPVITLVTFLTIYHEAGQKEIVPYAKGLIMMILPWFMYIFAIIFLTPRLGFLPSLTTGFTLYVVLALIILKKF